MKIKLTNKKKQYGQTLIETVVAIFMLTMGITSAVGLAIYALNSTTNVNQQIIAIGLAREGIEAAKNMRDTNWLRQTSAAIHTNCYNFQTGANTARCYRNWLTQVSTYNLNVVSPATSKSVRLRMNKTTKDWIADSCDTGKFGLSFDTATSSVNSFVGYYAPNSPGGGAGVCASAGSPLASIPQTPAYAREIVITLENTAPQYNGTGTGPRVKVASRVWWTGPKCPAATETFPTAADRRCAVELITYLTNWKNY